MTTPAPLAVSIGEPAGIGPDVLLLACAAAEAGAIPPLPAFFVLADEDHIARRADLLGVSCKRLNIKPLANHLVAAPAQPNTDDAKGVIEAIDRCVAAAVSGEASGLVTLPINKKSLYDAGFSHPGHTEYLGSLAEAMPGALGRTRAVMMLAGPDLRTVPVTIHIPLSDVPDALTQMDIEETGRIVARDLRERFGIATPRIAISGLNPHAGEEGAMGREDLDIIAPAVATLQNEGVDAFGPLPADTMFHERARQGYDAALCMYHDQALIPAKALAFDDAVNVTLGLPFIRTSPDHGTAFDIAGTGKANPASFIAALRIAARMAQNSAT